MKETIMANPPIDTLRDGPLKATIWKNETDKGAFYNIDLTRAFKTDDGFQDTTSFRSSDLLRVAFLAQQAHARVIELKANDKSSTPEPE